MIKQQKTYFNQVATLFLVTTPIGNLKEVSPRVLTILKTVAMIFSEDTRVTKRFLTHFHISTPLTSLHKFNEKEKTNNALTFLQQGENIALVSCAGTPLIADPGQYLVSAVLTNDFNVTSIGINSPLLVAVICSGFFHKQFSFGNFLPATKNKKKQELLEITNSSIPVVYYDSVYKIKATLLLCQELFPEKHFFLGREISKKYETFYWGKFQDLVFSHISWKGEFVLVLAPG